LRFPSRERRTAGREPGRRSSFPFVVGGILAAFIPLNAALFQLIMLHVEDRSYSWITALYWTVVTMSTLGYGDIVFYSDAGRLFSVGVMLSGILLLLVALPYVSIEFLIEPLRRAQELSRVPRRAPAGERGHVIITRYDPIAASLIGRLRTDGIPCYVLEPDPAEAAHLSDRGVRVVTGDPESRVTYELLGIERSRTVFANHEDTTNTNIALTVREASPDVPIIALAEHEDSTDILELSGCSHVLALKVRLGEYLANRVSAGLGKADIVGTVKGLQIAEFSARDTPLAGQTVRDTHLRERTGLNIVGLWHRGRLVPAFPGVPITQESIVVVVGTTDQLTALDGLIRDRPVFDAPILLVGASTVGGVAARALKRKGVRVHVLDRDPQARERMVGIADEVFGGDANDRDALMRAGLTSAAQVLLTTHDDAMNVYLAVYCRRLKPDLRIVSRVTHEQNLEAIHRAGADFVLSYSSLGAEAVLSLIEGHELVILGEGVDLFSLPLPRSLHGKTLAATEIGSRTGLSVVAVEQGGRVVTTLRASMTLEAGAEIIMLGSVQQRRDFAVRFGP